MAGSSQELDPDIEALLDDSIFELQAPVPTNNECVPAATIVGLLAQPSPFSIVGLLREDIYRKTTGPVTRRSLLDEPAITPDVFYNTHWAITTDLFFNFTPKVFFTKNSAFLRSFIDLNNQNIVNELTNIIGALNETGLLPTTISASIPEALGLFTTIKLQQYRAGFMLGCARQWENWLIHARVPLYYLLENFFLNKQEIDRIKNNAFFKTDDAGVGTSDENEARKFGLKHLACDKFGLGDTRLSLLAHPYSTDRSDLWIGVQATLPTASEFNTALIAGEFNPEQPIPPFNLQHYFSVALCNTNQALANAVLKRELTDFLLDGLDRLSTILINAPLGNGTHFGIGPELDWRCHMNEYFSAHTYASLQFYSPHHENRYFLIKKQESDFNRIWDDPDQASENLAILNRLLVQTIFPVGIKTTITPGLRFQINQSIMYKSEHWDGSIGFDYWTQRREVQGNPLPIIPFDLPLSLNKASRSAAHQGKIFASIGYYDTLFSGSRNTDWYLSISADGTLFNTGIGQSYIVSIRGGLEF